MTQQRDQNPSTLLIKNNTAAQRNNKTPADVSSRKPSYSRRRCMRKCKISLRDATDLNIGSEYKTGFYQNLCGKWVEYHLWWESITSAPFLPPHSCLTIFPNQEMWWVLCYNVNIFLFLTNDVNVTECTFNSQVTCWPFADYCITDSNSLSAPKTHTDTHTSV